jgi:GNAT superfamily N-acetyltransferase
VKESTPSATSTAAVVVRRLTATDRAGVQRMLGRCSPTTLYRRFGATAPAPHWFADSVVSRSAVIGIGAWCGDDLVGVGSVHLREDAPEFAILIEDTWQRRGVGARLIREMGDQAVATGWHHAVVEFLVTNTAARALLLSSCTHVWFSAPDAGLVSGLVLLRSLATPRDGD